MSAPQATAPYDPLTAEARNLLFKTASYLSQEDKQRLEKACAYAFRAHDGQTRKSGEPYITHPIAVATELAKWRMDLQTLSAGLMHDVLEDTGTTKEEMAAEFGETVADMVDGLSKLEKLKYDNQTEHQAESFRKLILAMTKDMRVIIVKLSDRLHNMRTLGSMRLEKRRRISQETLEIYAPIANRIGLNPVYRELQDLAFQNIHPARYRTLQKAMNNFRRNRRDVVGKVLAAFSQRLVGANIEAQIKGREKNLYSIHQKMRNKHLRFDEVMDIYGFRVITNSIPACYAALGALHNLYQPKPGKFKDYIAIPKSNGYQSLHTTLTGPHGLPIEVQIRTREMNAVAESGVASHWAYKSGDDKLDQATLNTNKWLQNILDLQARSANAIEFLEHVKVDLFPSEVYIFTPKGRILVLPEGATPVDFAYAVHTEVGNHCVGAKVNGSVVPLTHTLEMGDRVEILTNKNARPSHDWMTLVQTPSARAKIRKYFAEESRSDDTERGRSELAKELRKRGYGISTTRTVKALTKVVSQFDYHTIDDLFAGIGAGKCSIIQVVNKVSEILEEGSPEAIAQAAREREKQAAKEAAISQNKPLTTAYAISRTARGARHKRNNCGVVVKGDSDLLVHLAHCCNPVAGDDIIGFVTRGRGVSVHRANCPNVQDLLSKENANRIIDVAWDTSGATEFRVEIVIEAIDRTSLLKDITIALSDSGANILSAATQVGGQGVVRMRFLVAISDASLLDTLLATVARVPSVYDARRIMPGEGANQMKRRKG